MTRYCVAILNTPYESIEFYVGYAIHPAAAIMQFSDGADIGNEEYTVCVSDNLSDWMPAEMFGDYIPAVSLDSNYGPAKEFIKEDNNLFIHILHELNEIWGHFNTDHIIHNDINLDQLPDEKYQEILNEFYYDGPSTMIPKTIVDAFNKSKPFLKTN